MALLRCRAILCGRANSRTAAINGMQSVDQLWRMIRREAESAVARDPVFGAALSSAIFDHPDFAHARRIRWARGSAKSGGSRAVCAARPDAFGPARSDRCGEPRSAEHRRSRSRDDGAAAAAVELQGLRRAAGVARLELALAPAPHDLALLLQSLSSDQLQVSIHPSASIGTSVFLDHATGIIIGAFAVDRRRRDDPAERHHRPKAFGAGPRPENRQRRIISAPDRPLSAVSASAISPRSAPAR